MVTAVVLLALWGAVASAVAWRLHRYSYVPLTRRVVLVNFIQADRPALRGVLVKRHGSYLLLQRATLLEHDGATVPVDGDVLVDQANIAFIQVLAQP